MPQSFTGFLPFELLYGRTGQGPLDILRDTWEVAEGVDQSVISYILSIREKIAQMTEVVQKNLCSKQEAQKRWYMIRQPERDVLTLETRC